MAGYSIIISKLSIPNHFDLYLMRMGTAIHTELKSTAIMKYERKKKSNAMAVLHPFEENKEETV